MHAPPWLSQKQQPSALASALHDASYTPLPTATAGYSAVRAHFWHPLTMPRSLAPLLVCTTAFAPQSIRPRSLLALRAVDYEAELWRSGSLNTPDAELNEWCEKWARRAIIGEGAGGASVKLTTPVKLS